MLRPDFVNISKRLRSFIKGEVSNKTFSRCNFLFLFFFFHAPCIRADIFGKAFL